MVSPQRCFLIIWITVILIASYLYASAATVDEYNRTVVRASERIQYAVRMDKARPGSGKPVLDGLVRSLPSTMPVEVKDGKPISADLRWIKDEIKAAGHERPGQRRERLTELATRMKTAAGAGAIASPPGGVSTSEARSALRRVLAQKEYRPSVVNDIWVRAIRAIQEAVSTIFGAVPDSAWGIMGYILAGIAILAFALALIYVTLKLVAYYGSPAPRKVRVEERRERVSKRPSLEALLQAAEDEASRARYREAFRHIYLATLFLLDKAHLITYADGSTNGEYMRALRRQSASEQARVFGDMTLLFDQSIYGSRDVSADDYSRSKDGFHELEAML